jgi:pyrroloquinoline quinone biosynthesis protein D
VIALEDRLRIAARARLRFDEKTKQWLLVYPERGLQLADTAASILQLCDGTRTVEGVVTELATKYEGAPREVLEKDVLAFLSSMEERALVERT